MERNTIGHIHSFGFDKGIKRYLKKRNLYKIGDIADFCFSCSEKTGRWAYKNQEFTVLKNAIDTNLFQYSSKIRNFVRNDLGISNELVIGVVGSIHKVKNPVGVLDIFENILKRKPNTKLLWVGDGNMRCYVEKRIIKDDIQNHVILTGVRSDVHRLMQAMFTSNLGMSKRNFLKGRIKNGLLYTCYGCFAGYSPQQMAEKSDQRLLMSICLPFGYLMYKIWKKKYY